MTALPERHSSREVSVVIPVLDHATTIGEAIESVLAQTAPPGEVIVVDDGSTDGSGDVARSFGELVRVVRQATGGISNARNRGLAETSLPLVGFVDADDRWLAEKLRAQLELLTPSVDMVSGWVAQVLDGDWPTVVRDGPPPESVMPGPICETVLVRRAVFDRIGLFDERFRAGEFIDWYSRARDAGIVTVVVPAVVVLRRIHARNHGVRERAVYRDYLDVVRATLERRREQGREPGAGA